MNRLTILLLAFVACIAHGASEEDVKADVLFQDDAEDDMFPKIPTPSDMQPKENDVPENAVTNRCTKYTYYSCERNINQCIGRNPRHQRRCYYQCGNLYSSFSYRLSACIDRYRRAHYNCHHNALSYSARLLCNARYQRVYSACHRRYARSLAVCEARPRTCAFHIRCFNRCYTSTYYGTYYCRNVKERQLCTRSQTFNSLRCCPATSG